MPGTKTLFEERYAIFSACRFRSCDEKGWFMIDVENQEYLAAIRHFYWDEEESRTRGSLLLFSVSFDSWEDVPDLYRQSLGRWSGTVFENDRNQNTEFAIVRFMNGAAAIEEVCRDCIPH